MEMAPQLIYRLACSKHQKLQRTEVSTNRSGCYDSPLESESIYDPTSEKQSNIIRGSGRVRYTRAALLVRPKS
jgi:hypothetical protein